MELEKIKFDKNNDTIPLAIKSNIGNKVLLEDVHEGILFGEITKESNFDNYFLLQGGERKRLFYQNLQDLYLVKPSK